MSKPTHLPKSPKISYDRAIKQRYCVILRFPESQTLATYFGESAAPCAKTKIRTLQDWEKESHLIRETANKKHGLRPYHVRTTENMQDFTTAFIHAVNFADNNKLRIEFNGHLVPYFAFSGQIPEQNKLRDNLRLKNPSYTLFSDENHIVGMPRLLINDQKQIMFALPCVEKNKPDIQWISMSDPFSLQYKDAKPTPADVTHDRLDNPEL